MDGKMKKSTVIIAVVLMLVLTAVVGCYAFLSGRAKEKEKEAELTAVQLVLSKDLDRDYPATPKAVIRYYTEIEKCFYNETCTDEELEQLGMKARQLYDEELLANNEVGTYLTRLKTEIEEGGQKNDRCQCGGERQCGYLYGGRL